MSRVAPHRSKSNQIISQKETQVNATNNQNSYKSERENLI